MNPDDLLKLMKRLYVYIPSNIAIRSEVENIINHLKSQRQKFPHIEIVEKTDETNDDIKVIEQENNENET